MRILQCNSTFFFVSQIKLQEAYERAEGVHQRAAQALLIRQDISELRLLLKEMDHLCAYIPEMPTIATLVQKGSDWVGQLKRAMADNVPLKRMRTLLHSGERMGVLMPEVSTTRGAVYLPFANSTRLQYNSLYDSVILGLFDM